MWDCWFFIYCFWLNLLVKLLVALVSHFCWRSPPNRLTPRSPTVQPPKKGRCWGDTARGWQLHREFQGVAVVHFQQFEIEADHSPNHWIHHKYWKPSWVICLNLESFSMSPVLIWLILSIDFFCCCLACFCRLSIICHLSSDQLSNEVFQTGANHHFVWLGRYPLPVKLDQGGPRCGDVISKFLGEKTARCLRQINHF